ncbi:MAG: arsenic metallochaperone ArsD family protein [Candidatus Lokiarchaeota archaeon]|nr:arsenic metallochaperone ArsD family protein [Candidatus Lokiarchaeota archaeon]
MKIKVLGSGCPTCKTLYKNVQDVVAKLGMNTDVEYSTDISEIVKLGAMSSPVFAIDGKVMAAGKVPDNDEIEKMILEKCSPENKNDSGGCSCGGKC